MSFCYNTQIADSKDSARSIQEFINGDLVWVAEGPDLRSWVQKNVVLSMGEPEMNMCIKIDFFSQKKGRSEELLVTGDQPFLMPDQTLKEARKLSINDKLVCADGTTVAISSVQTGRVQTGEHTIATSMEPATNPGGHLLLANGIVVGDFALQINMRR